MPSCPWGLPLAGPSPPSNPLTPHLLRKAHHDGPVSHNTCLAAFAPGTLGPSDSLIFFPLHLPLLNLLHNLLVYYAICLITNPDGLSSFVQSSRMSGCQRHKGRLSIRAQPEQESRGRTGWISRFSRVRLCATPWTAAYQAPPSMGFSRQKYWSAVPLPSPISSLQDYTRGTSV